MQTSIIRRSRLLRVLIGSLILIVSLLGFSSAASGQSDDDGDFTEAVKVTVDACEGLGEDSFLFLPCQNEVVPYAQENAEPTKTGFAGPSAAYWNCTPPNNSEGNPVAPAVIYVPVEQAEAGSHRLAIVDDGDIVGALPPRDNTSVNVYRLSRSSDGLLGEIELYLVPAGDWDAIEAADDPNQLRGAENYPSVTFTIGCGDEDPGAFANPNFVSTSPVEVAILVNQCLETGVELKVFAPSGVTLELFYDTGGVRSATDPISFDAIDEAVVLIPYPGKALAVSTYQVTDGQRLPVAGDGNRLITDCVPEPEPQGFSFDSCVASLSADNADENLATMLAEECALTAALIQYGNDGDVGYLYDPRFECGEGLYYNRVANTDINLNISGNDGNPVTDPVVQEAGVGLAFWAIMLDDGDYSLSWGQLARTFTVDCAVEAAAPAAAQDEEVVTNEVLAANRTELNYGWTWWHLFTIALALITVATFFFIEQRKNKRWVLLPAVLAVACYVLIAALTAGP